jgi:hypothetical protein
MEHIIKFVICKYFINYKNINNALSLCTNKNTGTARYSLINCHFKFPLKFKLEKLVLYGKKGKIINDDNLKCLAGIKVLILPMNDKITDIGLSYLIGIQKLNLMNNTKITKSGLACLGKIKLRARLQFKNDPSKRYFNCTYKRQYQGHFTGQTPKQAASKAFTYLHKNRNFPYDVPITFELIGMTRGFLRKFTFVGTRTKLDKPLKIMVNVVGEKKNKTFNYTNKITCINVKIV